MNGISGLSTTFSFLLVQQIFGSLSFVLFCLFSSRILWMRLNCKQVPNVVGHITRRARNSSYFFSNSRRHARSIAAMAEINDRENVELGELLKQWGLEPLQKNVLG